MKKILLTTSLILLLTPCSFASDFSKEGAIGYARLGKEAKETSKNICGFTSGPISKASTPQKEVTLTHTRRAKVCYDFDSKVIDSIIAKEVNVVAKRSATVYMDFTTASSKDECQKKLRKGEEVISDVEKFFKGEYDDYKLVVGRDSSDGKPKFKEDTWICASLDFGF